VIKISLQFTVYSHVFPGYIPIETLKIRRTAQAADIAGIRALVVHAKDDEARAWYEQFDFEPSPTDPLHLFLLMKDIKKILQET
jgi:hypothetical protein